jgi:hypothetical protein
MRCPPIVDRVPNSSPAAAHAGRGGRELGHSEQPADGIERGRAGSTTHILPADYAIGSLVEITICTASALNCGPRTSVSRAVTAIAGTFA